jgi:hypothetical protein
MSDDQEIQKKVAMQWKRATPFLAAQRRRDIRRQNQLQAFDALDSACRHAIKTNRPPRTSGFVKMYEVLQRSRG